MNATSDWRGEDDSTPVVTEQVLRWYRLRVAQWFQECREKHPDDLSPGLIDSTIAWFADRPDEFLCWKPETEYRGGNYASGYWALNFAAMQPAVRRAGREIDAEQRRCAYELMGPVTGADVERALALLHGSASLTEEADGMRLVIPEQQGAYLHHKYNVQDYWPRLCRRCGQDYKPATRIQSRTCSACLAKAKAEREQARANRG